LAKIDGMKEGIAMLGKDIQRSEKEVTRDLSMFMICASNSFPCKKRPLRCQRGEFPQRFRTVYKPFQHEGTSDEENRASHNRCPGFAGEPNDHRLTITLERLCMDRRRLVLAHKEHWH
jgi:hypothetical protein